MKMVNLYDHIEEVEEIIDYHFSNSDLLLQAFTRSSYSNQYGGENNEVLEFIGDKVLDYCVVKLIAENFGFLKHDSDYYDEENDNDEFCIVANKDEADFTELKRQIVSNHTLAKRIDKLKLAKYLYLGDSDIQNNVVNQEKIKADLFEAILGAIAIDCDWDQDILLDSVWYLLQIDEFFDDVDTEEERPDRFKEENAINTLKELSEHGQCSIPEYYIQEEQTLRNGQYYWSCTCKVRSWSIQETGLATSKKEAKRYAAYLVLCERYGLQDEFTMEEEYE